jgi:hypothetical protein
MYAIPRPSTTKTPPIAPPMVDVMLAGAAGFSPAAAAPRRASFDPTEGEDVNDADLLPVTEGVIDGDEDLDDVTEIVGLN